MEWYATKVKKTSEKKNAELDIYLGIISRIDDPFIVFVRLQDLNLKHDYIYFFAYSLGLRKIVIWGKYIIATDKFHIQNACQYEVQELINLTRDFKNRLYVYTSNAVTNRIKDTMIKQEADYSLYQNKKFGFTINRKEYFHNYDEYIITKYILAYFNRKIDEKQVEARLKEIKIDLESVLEDFYLDFETEYYEQHKKPIDKNDTVKYDILFDEYLSEKQTLVNEYEKHINIDTVDTKIRVLYPIIKLMSDKFKIYIQHSPYAKRVLSSGLPICPRKNECDSDNNNGSENHLCELYTWGSDEPELA